MNTGNLSDLPATVASSSPTLEAVVVAVLLLLGQGTHRGKDHVQQQTGLREQGGSGSGQARALWGQKTPPSGRRGEHCLAFLLLQQCIAGFCSLTGSPQLLRTQEMLELGSAGAALCLGGRTLLPLCLCGGYFWHLLASQLPRRGKSLVRCLWKSRLLANAP